MKSLVNDTARDFQWKYCQNIGQNDIIQSVTNPSVGVPAGALCLHRTRNSDIRTKGHTMSSCQITVPHSMQHESIRANCNREWGTDQGLVF